MDLWSSVSTEMTDRRAQPIGATAAALAPEVNELRHRAALFVHGPVFTIRDRVFHALFYRLAIVYSRSVPRSLQRVLEFAMLFEALAALATMTYVHFAFTRDPVSCLQHVRDTWPRDGILRVEILRNASVDYSLMDSYRKEFPNFDAEMRDELKTASAGATNHSDNATFEEPSFANQSEFINMTTQSLNDQSQLVEGPGIDQSDHSDAVATGDSDTEEEEESFSILHFWLQDTLFVFERHAELFAMGDVHVFEFATEFGFLRMSPKTRRRLNITTQLVVLDPTKDACFGSSLSRFLLEEFLGYEDVLLYSLKQLADDKPEKGFCRNVVTGDHYKFVDMSVSRVCYLPAAFLMILFTMSISMLLRYSHHQIFVFIVDVLHVFDRTILVTFPLAPLLTAVLALIGVEALISELFTEASTGFYVILIVWLADQYDVICCHTPTSRRHWLRFFYLYHFVFYAYHYRFNGHFSSIALATSWLFIQHSMIYFFHHYELPAVEQQAQVQNLIALAQRQQLPHNLVTVMTRTMDGEITRTTANFTTITEQIVTRGGVTVGINASAGPAGVSAGPAGVSAGPAGVSAGSPASAVVGGGPATASAGDALGSTAGESAGAMADSTMGTITGSAVDSTTGAGTSEQGTVAPSAGSIAGPSVVTTADSDAVVDTSPSDGSPSVVSSTSSAVHVVNTVIDDRYSESSHISMQNGGVGIQLVVDSICTSADGKTTEITRSVNGIDTGTASYSNMPDNVSNSDNCDSNTAADGGVSGLVSGDPKPNEPFDVADRKATEPHLDGLVAVQAVCGINPIGAHADRPPDRTIAEDRAVDKVEAFMTKTPRRIVSSSELISSAVISSSSDISSPDQRPTDIDLRAIVSNGSSHVATMDELLHDDSLLTEIPSSSVTTAPQTLAPSAEDVADCTQSCAEVKPPDNAGFSSAVGFSGDNPTEGFGFGEKVLSSAPGEESALATLPTFSANVS